MAVIYTYLTYIYIATVGNTIQTVNSPIYEYMSTPGSIEKSGTTHSNIQTAQSCPSLVGNWDGTHNALVSTLLSERIIPPCQPGIILNIFLYLFPCYGVLTSAGRACDQGLLPRALDTLFSSLQGKHYPRRDLRPQYHCALVCLDEREARAEEARKEALFRDSADSLSTSSLSRASSLVSA